MTNLKLSGQTAGQTSGQMSGQDIVKKMRKSPDTVAKYVRRLADKNPDIFPDTSWSLDRTFTADQVAVIFEKKKRVVRTKKELPIVPPPAAEAETPPAHTPRAVRFRWPAFGLSEFLAVAIYGHTILVWYEVAVIFGVPGILAGVVVFALKHAAVTICRSGKFQDYVTDVLGVAFILDLLAVWAHHAAFADSMPERFAADDGNVAAWILGFVVAAGAFLSLYFTEKTANKDVEAN